MYVVSPGLHASTCTASQRSLGAPVLPYLRNSPSKDLEPYQCKYGLDDSEAAQFSSFTSHYNRRFSAREPCNCDLSVERYVNENISSFRHIVLLWINPVVRASRLINNQKLQTPNCFARIVVDNDQALSTKRVNGSKPEWEESFVM